MVFYHFNSLFECHFPLNILLLDLDMYYTHFLYCCDISDCIFVSEPKMYFVLYPPLCSCPLGCDWLVTSGLPPAKISRGLSLVHV